MISREYGYGLIELASSTNEAEEAEEVALLRNHLYKICKDCDTIENGIFHAKTRLQFG